MHCMSKDPSTQSTQSTQAHNTTLAPCGGQVAVNQRPSLLLQAAVAVVGMVAMARRVVQVEIGISEQKGQRGN